MLPDLAEIRRIRRALGISQAKLAALAGVSQGTIAKIEGGDTSPSYEVVGRVLRSLEAERKRAERVATIHDVRSRHVVSISSHLLLEQAVEEMRRHQFSQLPVLDGGRNVGSLSERRIAELLTAGTTAKDLGRLRVAQVMEPPFPTVDEKAPVALAAELLKHYGAVLVADRGEVVGIVTKSDLLKLI